MAEYVRDTFSRTLAAGWGTGELGGAWSESLASVTSSVVTNDRSRITFTGTLAGQGDEQLAAATAARDVALATSFNTPSQWWLDPGLWEGTSVWLFARVSGAVGTPVGYYARALVATDKSIKLTIGHTSPAGVPVVLATLNYPAGSANDTRQWRLELQLRGANPTHARARLYALDLAVPGGSAGWLNVDDEAGPQTAGVYAARFSRPVRPTANPHLGNLFDYYATDYPVPRFTATPTGLSVAFDAATSSGDFTAYAWDWGDGTAAGSGATPTHAYAGAGSYQVTLTGTTRWGSIFRGRAFVTVALPLPAGDELLPMVRIDGVDVCDAVHSVSWSAGRTRWFDGFTGQTCSIRLRGIYPVEQGQAVSIAVPAAAGGEPLWLGIVDQVTEVREIDGARDETLVIAMDHASQLARFHLFPQSILPLEELPGRLDDLRGLEGLAIRYGYPGAPVLAGRWLELKKKTQAADDLRSRTFLELINDALVASFAFGYIARDGALVYAPVEAPAGLAATPALELDDGLDCASRVTLDRNALDAIVNRWTVGSGDDFDDDVRPSIEQYGERSYAVPSDTLADDQSFPFAMADYLGLRSAMAEPERAATVEIPVTDWDQATITAEPLDFATWEGELYTVTGVRHEVTVGDAWRGQLTLDRNPWAIDGRTPP